MELKPSGYQIINIGSIDLSSTVTINKGEKEWADILIEKGNEGKLADKPILISLYDTYAEVIVSGFCTLCDDGLYLVIGISLCYAITITPSSVVIQKIEA